MKLKNSFFNKTLFNKNVALYWPLWVVYTIIVMCMHPMTLLLEGSYIKRIPDISVENKIERLLESLYTTPTIWLIVFVAIIFGMALYSYLYNHKSANMIHALPVDRNQLFGTNVISGLVFLILPLLLAAGSMSVIALGYKLPGIEYIWIWFLLMAGIAFVMFGIVTFCAMFTGHIVTVPVFFFIFNYLSRWAYYLVYILVVAFGYGVSKLGIDVSNLSIYLSPLECLTEKVQSTVWGYSIVNPEKVGFVGEEFVIIYSLVALLLYAIAYVTYQKRHIERVGSFITVNWLKEVFRWGAGMTIGVFGAVFIKEILMALRISMGVVAFVVILLFLGAVGYLAAEMFVSKSFKVFKKKTFANCGVFVIALMVSFFGVYVYAQDLEKQIPEKEEVLYASISSGYQIQLEAEEVELILQIHEEILEQKDLCEEYIVENDSRYVHIFYQLKDGNTLNRSYEIPRLPETNSIIEKIAALEKDGENFIKNMFGESYDRVNTFMEGKLVFEEENGNASTINLDSEKLKVLYEAFIADAKAGNLIKYNVYGVYENEEHLDTNVYIDFEYVYPNENANQNEDVQHTRWGSVYFGADCENIVNALINLEIIESAEKIK